MFGQAMPSARLADGLRRLRGRRRGGDVRFRVPGGLRGRLVLAATVAVAVGIGAGVGFAYVAVRHELIGRLEYQLHQQAGEICRMIVPPSSPAAGPSLKVPNHGDDGQPPDHTDDYDLQFVAADGRTVLPLGQTDALPTNAADLAVAAGTAGSQERNVVLTDAPTPSRSASEAGHGTPQATSTTALRVETLPIASGWAVQVGAATGDVDDELAHIGLMLLVAGLVGVALAALLGAVVARTALRPVRRLTAAAELIATTSDLDHRISLGRRGESGPRDELGRLARSFNAMLDALRHSTQAQKRLVVDASHELRTPLTTVRTNVEMLARSDRLDEEDRRRVLDGAIVGLRELTDLTTDLIELARGEEPSEAAEELSFDRLVDRVAARTRTHWPSVDVRVDAEPVLVHGVRSRLEVAVRNLLDNAAKFSPPDRAVEVRLRAPGTLTVRDHGPGIPAEDLPYIFDRFYRSPQARGKPGSGLGLAIVRQVADRHNGTVSAAEAPGGGTIVTLTLIDAPDDEGLA